MLFITIFCKYGFPFCWTRRRVYWGTKKQVRTKTKRSADHWTNLDMKCNFFCKMAFFWKIELNYRLINNYYFYYFFFCFLADVKKLSAVYDASRSKLIENETHSQVGFVVGSLNLSNRGLFLCLHSLIQTPSLRQLCKRQTQCW